jgi:triosephosphate isomerase
MILVNFKIYQESFGQKGINLAKICQKVAKESGIKIIPVVSALEAYRIMREAGVKEVCLQHVDEYNEGRWTGAVSAAQAKEMEVWGTLLNHSEKKIPLGTAAKIKVGLPRGFTGVLCVHSRKQAEKWVKKIKPEIVAYEPSYLIADPNKSVSSENPITIKEIAEMIAPIPLLVGAGVKTKEDVAVARRQGAAGVLVASDIIKARNPEKELRDLTEGFKISSV